MFNVSNILFVAFNGDYTIFDRAANEMLAERFVKHYPEKAFSYAEEFLEDNDFLKGFSMKEDELRRFKATIPSTRALNHYEQTYFGVEALGWRKMLTFFDFQNVELSFYDHIQETVDVLHQQGINTGIFSSGPAPLHERAAKKFGIPYCNATPLLFDKKGRMIGEGKRQWNKGIVLADYIKQIGVQPGQVAVVEHSDLNMCKTVMDNEGNILGRVILFNCSPRMKNFITEHQNDNNFHLVDNTRDLMSILPYIL